MHHHAHPVHTATERTQAPRLSTMRRAAAMHRRCTGRCNDVRRGVGAEGSSQRRTQTLTRGREGYPSLSLFNVMLRPRSIERRARHVGGFLSPLGREDVRASLRSFCNFSPGTKYTPGPARTTLRLRRGSLATATRKIPGTPRTRRHIIVNVGKRELKKMVVYVTTVFQKIRKFAFAIVAFFSRRESLFLP